ncbi:MAG: SUMF1/EgtB/PvdO family nonheme iron enzyme, partial [Myxococcales bacterium]|nr:SUMF1/EgtB/PvdO family nonheme iron enzyme [Myxococcales bacterium]
ALRVVPAGALRFDDGYGAPRTLTVQRAVAMSERPVTRAQYQAVMGVAPPTPTPDPLDPRPHPVKPADPATQLTVSQARAYCDALSRAEGRAPHYASGGDGYRLPSEAEWVMACAAGRPPAEAPAVHPWGAVPGEALWEWVDDRFSRPGPDGRPVVAPGAGQVMRGAGRRLPPADRCRERGELAPGSRGSATGFRVVRPLASTERR